MDNPLFYDVTLRDGNHALRHALELDFIAAYCKLAESAGVWAVEVGHGNGLGASSYLVGKSSSSDREMITTARENLKKSKLAVHSIPGFSTIKRDLVPAIDLGVDIFRVATHVTESTLAEKHIEYLVSREKMVHGVLMMSHMIDISGLVKQASIMKDFGASAIILMDSAGNLVPKEVHERVDAIKNKVEIEIGFHAHNNLGVAVSNAITALNAGANLVDGASMGLGAGAGNAQLENIVAVAGKTSSTNYSLKEFIKMSKKVEETYSHFLPRTTANSLESGLAGVFSGYAPQVNEISKEFGLDPLDLWNEIGRRKLVAGQESMIREIALDLMNL